MIDIIRRVIYQTHDRFNHTKNRELIIEFLELCIKEDLEIEKELEILLEYAISSKTEATLVTKGVLICIQSNFPQVYDKVIKEQLARKREIEYYLKIRGLE